MSTKGKRSRKMPNKFKESLVQPMSATISEKTSAPKWFTLLCLEDSKKYISTVKSMETTDGLEVNQDELQMGDVVVWHYRGAPYEAKILSIHDKKPMPSDTKQSNKRKYVEDSSSESDDSTLPPKKTACREDTPVILSDIDSPVKSKSVTSIRDRISSLNQKISVKSGGHSCPSSDLSSQKAQPAKLTSQKLEAHLRPILSPQKVLPSDDFGQKLLRIEEHLIRLEEKIDSVVQHMASGSHAVKVEAEGAGQSRSPLKPQQLPVDEKKFITEAGVNLLTLRASNPAKYALSLLDALFTDEEMGRSCYAKTSRSVKPTLPADKIGLLEECIDYKFGRGTVNANRDDILKRCNQKCLDKGNPNKQMKKGKHADVNKENCN